MKILSTRFAIPTALLFLFGSCSVQDHLTPKPDQKCQLVEEIVRSSYVYEPQESFESNGVNFKIGLVAHQRYEYDNEGRVSRFFALPDLNPKEPVLKQRFEYTSNEVLQFFVDPPFESKKTIPLNKQGFVDDPKVTYNDEGYIVKKSFTYYYSTKYEYHDGLEEITLSNGNIIKRVLHMPQTGKTETYLYEYDLTRPALPTLYPFYGKESKNLLVKQTHYGDAFSYSINLYSYNFNENGQITRRTVFSKLYWNDGREMDIAPILSVNDYKIICQ